MILIDIGWISHGGNRPPPPFLLSLLGHVDDATNAVTSLHHLESLVDLGESGLFEIEERMRSDLALASNQTMAQRRERSKTYRVSDVVIDSEFSRQVVIHQPRQSTRKPRISEL